MVDPSITNTLFRRAEAHLQNGDAVEAEALLNKVLVNDPDHAGANHLLGILAGQRGQFDIAHRLISCAIRSQPNALYYYNLGLVLWREGKLHETLAAFDHSIELDSNQAQLHNGRGDILHVLRRFEEALISYEHAIRLSPGFAIAHNNRASALNSLGRFDEALVASRKALHLDSGSSVAYYNYAVTLSNLNRSTDAVAAYDSAIRLNPDFVDAHYNRGILLASLGRFEQAVSAYNQVIRISPNNAEAHNNRGNALQQLGRMDEAIAAYERAIRLKPQHTEAHNNRANVLRGLNRFAEAIDGYRRAFAIKPDHLYAFSNYVDTILRTCDWRNLPEIHEQVSERIRTGQSVDPFLALYCKTSAAEQLTCAKRFIKTKFPVTPKPVWRGEIYSHEKIRIAYLSADFHSHATSYLMIDLFEKHDRENFEVFGLSFGPDDDSNYRHRLARAFDHFYDVRGLDDATIAMQMAEMEVDIAIDLKGFTQDARPGIFAFRPAPIQVNYLGYPGTMGADFIDCIIADPVLIPESQRVFFSEHIVYLPDSYQSNDPNRYIAEITPTRSECGLPEEAFVLCCFNTNIKITPELFSVWMRLLKALPESVLWLLKDNEIAENNLRGEAQARGIDPERLVFAPRIGVDEHLARHCLADIFLDTLPCNAHTSASDALWAGLPVLTCAGNTFAGRVASSLLHAVGLSELVTYSLDEYERLALTLAMDASGLGELRNKLARNRCTAPLFDSSRYRRNIEQAYTQMWELWQHG